VELGSNCGDERSQTNAPRLVGLPESSPTHRPPAGVEVGGRTDGPDAGQSRRRRRPRPTTEACVITEDVLRDAFISMGGEMLGFARRSLFAKELGDDAVQETFVRAWRSRRNFDPSKGSLRTWLYAIERNAIIDVMHQQSRVATDLLDSELEGVSMDGLEDAIVSWQVEDALKRLHVDHRRVIHELYFNGRSGREVSALLEIPEGTVRSRAFYGLKSLRLMLNEEGWVP
jgi:RNA polymerase sigma-70 factor, ECF subfamily